MKRNSGIFTIEDALTISHPTKNYSRFTDETGTEIVISNKVILRLYAILKITVGENFEEYVKGLFKEELK